MPETKKHLLSLPAKQAELVDAKIERDAAVERWLREEVAPTYDVMKANPERGIAVGEAFDKVRARHRARAKGAGEAAGGLPD